MTIRLGTCRHVLYSRQWSGGGDECLEIAWAQKTCGGRIPSDFLIVSGSPSLIRKTEFQRLMLRFKYSQIKEVD